MIRILYVKSSLFAEQSASSQLGDEFVNELLHRNPDGTLTTLDLGLTPLPHLAAEEFSSWIAPTQDRTESQQSLASRSDALIDQLLAHDVLVMAVPMYNLGIPSTLKAWIDRVARAGKTFRYSANGPKGLIRGVKAFLVFSRGGIYRDTPLDTQTSYLKDALGLMGIIDVETIYAEGLNMDDDARAAGYRRARGEMRHILLNLTLEVQHAAA